MPLTSEQTIGLNLRQRLVKARPHFFLELSLP
jgi:hypothetical protein